MMLSIACVPSWHDRHTSEGDPVRFAAPPSIEVELYIVYDVPLGRFLFHSGAPMAVFAACGVWQNTQISSVPAVTRLSLVAPTRLCLVLAMPAVATLAAIVPSTKAAAIAIQPPYCPMRFIRFMMCSRLEFPLQTKAST